MRAALFLLLTLCAFKGLAQKPYADSVYNPYIKTVQFYNTTKEASFPIITLQTDEQVQLAFDDLRGSIRNYYYTLEHCDSKWLPTNVAVAEYLQGFREDKIIDYFYSTNTIQKYTHYEVKLPNKNMMPKISGNYILKVYEDSNKDKLAFTRKLYVVNNKVSVSADVVSSANPSNRQTHQKINFQVNYGSLLVQNPNRDIKVLLMQNMRPETTVWNITPTSIRGTQLIYNDVNTNDFAGGNEFRRFDIRTLRVNSERVARIYRDSANTVMLLGDPLRIQALYSFQFDNNGNYFILNSDGFEPRRDGDYAHIYFSLAANKSDKDGAAYLVGRFNDYKIDANSKMEYDPTKGRFNISQFLKQGVYDYEYIWLDARTGIRSDIPIEGAHFETENDYQLLVYYRSVSGRWDELVGYRAINTVKK